MTTQQHQLLLVISPSWTDLEAAQSELRRHTSKATYPLERVYLVAEEPFRRALADQVAKELELEFARYAMRREGQELNWADNARAAVRVASTSPAVVLFLTDSKQRSEKQRLHETDLLLAIAHAGLPCTHIDATVITNYTREKEAA